MRGILGHSGWSGVEFRPVEIACAMPERELVGYFTRFGPVGVVLQNADKRTRAQAHGDEVRFIAACCMVTAPVTTLSPQKLRRFTVEQFLRPVQ